MREFNCDEPIKVLGFSSFFRDMTDLFADYRKRIDASVGYEAIDLAELIGLEGFYARFRIKATVLPDGRPVTGLLVAHEGDWIKGEAMSFYSGYERYEDVQKALGKGLEFRGKSISREYRRSLFLFTFSPKATDCVLAVPATGEEIDFEVYALVPSGRLVLLVEQEL